MPRAEHSLSDAVSIQAWTGTHAEAANVDAHRDDLQTAEKLSTESESFPLGLNVSTRLSLRARAQTNIIPHCQQRILIRATVARGLRRKREQKLSPSLL